MNYTSSARSSSVLIKDIAQAKLCFNHEAYKAAIVLSGSILERALFDRLSIHPTTKQTYSKILHKKRPRMERWSLGEMLTISADLHLLQDETLQLCGSLQNYSRLIHPTNSRHPYEKTNKNRAWLALKALRQSLIDLEIQFSTLWRDVYFINIRNIRSSLIDKSVARSLLTKIAEKYDFTVKTISSYSALRSILRNPPHQSIFMNLHGEIMPVPPGRSWKDFYVDLGNVVKNYGWILVNLTGYPFYYHSSRIIGPGGLNAFLSVVGASANCFNPRPVKLTSEGTKLARRFELIDLQPEVNASNCADWQGLPQKIVFLNDDRFCGVSAVRVGRGWFIQVGLRSSLGVQNPTQQQLAFGDRILAHLGFTSSLYITGRT
ncbi:MAG: hypothetical protein JSV35_07205 [Candidatus Bathyarchaeota archaeon]|nr:MAG: hypothetical protein JSV35_07205 [Candidatus Bathyarchaeota archaeon]